MPRQLQNCAVSKSFFHRSVSFLICIYSLTYVLFDFFAFFEILFAFLSVLCYNKEKRRKKGEDLGKSIYRFRRDFLGDGSIRVEKKRGDTSFVAHVHDYFEIILYRNCNGRCIVNGSIYPIFGDCLFFLTPKDYHKIETSNPDDASSVILSFSENLIDPELRARLSFSPRVWYHPTEEMIRIVEDLYENYSKKLSKGSKKLFHLLNVILCDVAEYGEMLNGQELCVGPAIAQAITIMLSDISQGYTLSDIARECGFSATYFSNLFHKEMGKPFKAWLNETRIEHAKGLLLESDLPILEICYECGYNTPSQFIRTFKKELGVSPSKYRKSKKVT